MHTPTRFMAAMAAMVALPAIAALASEGKTATPAARLGIAVTPEAGALAVPSPRWVPVIRDRVDLAANAAGASTADGVLYRH